MKYWAYLEDSECENALEVDQEGLDSFIISLYNFEKMNKHKIQLSRDSIRLLRDRLNEALESR